MEHPHLRLTSLGVDFFYLAPSEVSKDEVNNKPVAKSIPKPKTVTKVDADSVSEKNNSNSTSGPKKEIKEVVRIPQNNQTPKEDTYVMPTKPSKPKAQVEHKKFQINSKYADLDEVVMDYDTQETMPSFPDLSLSSKEEASFMSFMKPFEKAKTMEIEEENIPEKATKLGPTASKGQEKKASNNVVRVAEAASTLKQPEFSEAASEKAAMETRWIKFTSFSAGKVQIKLVRPKNENSVIFSFSKSTAKVQNEHIISRFNAFQYESVRGLSIYVLIQKSQNVDLKAVFKSKEWKDWQRAQSDSLISHISSIMIATSQKEEKEDEPTLSVNIMKQYMEQIGDKQKSHQIHSTKQKMDESSAVSIILNGLDKHFERIMDYQNEFMLKSGNQHTIFKEISK